MGQGSWRRKRVDRMEWRVGAVSGSSSRAAWPGERSIDGYWIGRDVRGGVSAGEPPGFSVQCRESESSAAPHASFFIHWVLLYARKILFLCRSCPCASLADQIAPGECNGYIHPGATARGPVPSILASFFFPSILIQ
jgi:hypothetical protein